MKELLDDPLKELPSKWWQELFLFLYWKVYAISFLAAMGILLMLFMRHTMGSDLDAVLAILILWGIMANVFLKANKNIVWAGILSFFVVFFVFLIYAPSLVAGVHGISFGDVTRWRWSHYELVFGIDLFTKSFSDPRSFYTTIIESTEWFIFYAFLTVVITEILHFLNPSSPKK